MKIFISAKPSAKEDRVEKLDDTHFKVWVREPPIRGRANAALTRLLAEYFKIPLSHVSIVQGLYSREKVVDIVN